MNKKSDNKNADIQRKKQRIERRNAAIQPFQWKKGQSGNPKGRPKGKTAKERAKDYLLTMTDEEFESFLEGMNKKDIWEMAEGKAKQDVEHSGEINSKIVSVDE